VTITIKAMNWRFMGQNFSTISAISMGMPVMYVWIVLMGMLKRFMHVLK